MATKSIGAAGSPTRDYSTVAAWIVYLQGLSFTEDEIGEHYGLTDGEETTAGDAFASITNGTNRVTLQAATGESFTDHADAATNPLRYDATKGAGIRQTATGAVAAIDVDIANFSLLELQVKRSIGYGAGVRFESDKTGIITKQAIIEHPAGTSEGAVHAGGATITFHNVAVIAGNDFGFRSVRAGEFRFVTILRPGGGGSHGFGSSYAAANSIDIKNCAVFGFANFMGDATKYTGSHNATDLASVGFGTNNQVSLTTADQIEDATAATPDLRAKSTGSLAGNGVAVAGVTIDIVGQTRADPPYIGAFEVVAAGGAASVGSGLITGLKLNRLRLVH